jgi:hypothetical protein
MDILDQIYENKDFALGGDRCKLVCPCMFKMFAFGKKI